MAEPFITEFVLDKRQAELDLGDLKIKFGHFASEVARTWNIASEAYNQLTSALAPVIQFTKEATAAAAESEIVERKLEAALRNRGQLTATAMTELNAFNAALQRRTNIEDESLATIQTTLTSMGVYRQDLRQATLAVVGLAERTDSQLEPATRAVGKALLGNVESLKKLGVEGDSVAAVISDLASQAELAAAGHDTYSFQVERLTVAYADFQEETGKAVTQSRSVKETISDSATVLQATTRVIQLLNAQTFQYSKHQDTILVQGLKMIPFLREATSGFQGLADGVVEAANALLQFTDDGFDPLAALSGGIATPNKKEEEALAKGARAAWAAEEKDYEKHLTEMERLENEAKRQEIADLDRRVRGFENERRFLRAQHLEREKQEKTERDRDRAHQEWRARDAELTRKIAKEKEERYKQSAADMLTVASMERDIHNAILSGAVNFGVAFADAVTSGQNVLGSFGNFLGSAVQQLGQTFFGLGLAAEAAHLLSFIPIFTGLVGPPGASAAAGAVAMATGVGLMVIGSQLGGSKGGGAAGGGRTGGGGGGGGPGSSRASGDRAQEGMRTAAGERERVRSDRDRDRRARDAATDEQDGKTTIIVQYRGRPLVTEREAGRSALKLVEKAQTLRGQRPRGRGR